MKKFNPLHYDDSSNIVVAPLEKINQQVKQQKQQDNKQQALINNQIINNNNKKSKNSITNKDINEEQDFQKQLQIPNESKVGQKLQSQIQKNVILLIILILISIPLLQGSTWFQTVSVYEKSLMNLVYFANKHPTQYQIQADIFIRYTSQFNSPLAYFKVKTDNISNQFPKDYPNYQQNLLQNRRSSDIQTYSYQSSTIGFDNRSNNALDSIMNIGRTLFVCVILILTTLFFSNDLQFAAIAPLEQMFDIVRKIALNPLNALRQIQEKNLCIDNIDMQQNKQITEPKILQNTIVKIGSLLAIGFGQAGTQIICRVIEDPSIINVMIPGNKIMAIFGFCDIRNFTDATQILEADVMLFVNQIAHICHKVTYQHLGSPNKNIGDAFLLVWKFVEEDCKISLNQNNLNIELKKSARVQQKADLAVLSIIKMIADITKSKKLQKYKHHAGLKQRIPDYNGVKMGFGLHVGWAIEGPIGSQYKIDASYLSSHVHMASRLEAATKGYGTGMLITGDVCNLMNKNRNNLRHIDRVLPSGQSQLMDLYTVDIDSKHLFQVSGVAEEKKLSQKQKKMAKVIQNINRKELLQSIVKEGATNALWNDEDIKIMKQTYKKQFYDIWDIGFKQYLQGNWSAALQNLKQIKQYAPYNFDGPSQSLIKYMQLSNGVAPQNWKGFREFD